MYKKVIYSILVSSLISCNLNSSTTELIILGTMHSNTKNFTSDSLFQEIKKTKPDIILIEADSSDFTDNFKRIKWSTTESKASIKYQKENPNVILRPFDYEGKNDFSMDYGIGDGNSYRLLNMLNNKEMFTSEQQKIWDDFSYYTNIVDSIGYHSTLKGLNSAITDSIVEIRQKIHYVDNLIIIKNRAEFEYNTSITKLNDTITFRESSLRTANFWHERNKSMAKNIMNTIKNNPEKKVLVLTGFQHRYYLINELEGKQREYNFKLK